MITRITGTVNRVLDEELRLQVGPLEYQVLVPECVRRQLQMRTGGEVTLHTTQYLEGGQMSNRFIPRLIGFTSEVELEFFDLFCTVDGIGVKKALKSLARPIKEIADAIQRKDSKWLTTLPGVGGSSADKIVAALQRKVMRFALMAEPRSAGEPEPMPEAVVQGDVLADAYNALLSVGHNPADARALLDQVLGSGKAVSSVEEVLMLIYKQK
ncbi:MAG: Holliday junction branch migration protein RuvA [Gemmataceae bacterium]